MSDRSVYAIASGKGGVGKTTTAINLGAMLADRGHEVVVVDTDLGMANLADFLDFEIGSPTLQEVLAGDADAAAALHRAPGDVDVLPTAPDIEAFARSDPANLDGVVADLRERYDYVLLDTGAGVSYDVLVPMALADGVLLVATPDVASVRDTAKTGDLAARVDTAVVGAVVTQRSSDILTADDVEETLGTDVLAVVPEDEAVPMGIDAGRPLAAFAPNAPAGQAYRDLAAVLTGEADPDPELDLDDGGVDVEFDADLPERDDPGGSGPDRPTSEQAAAGVRDATEADEPGGLLGGELAKAAEEIRAEAERATAEASASGGSREAGGRSTEARGESAESEGESTEVGSTETRDGSTEVGSAEAAGESADGRDDEARSVDDLIDEHLGDADGDFGDEAGDFDDETDDPLAGADDESAGDDGGGAGRGDGANREDAANPDAADPEDAAPAETGVPFDGGDRGGRTERRTPEDADERGDHDERGNSDDRADGVLDRLGSLFR